MLKAYSRRLARRTFEDSGERRTDPAIESGPPLLARRVTCPESGLIDLRVRIRTMGFADFEVDGNHADNAEVALENTRRRAARRHHSLARRCIVLSSPSEKASGSSEDAGANPLPSRRARTRAMLRRGAEWILPSPPAAHRLRPGSVRGPDLAVLPCGGQASQKAVQIGVPR